MKTLTLVSDDSDWISTKKFSINETLEDGSVWLLEEELQVNEVGFGANAIPANVLLFDVRKEECSTFDFKLKNIQELLDNTDAIAVIEASQTIVDRVVDLRELNNDDVKHRVTIHVEPYIDGSISTVLYELGCRYVEDYLNSDG